MLTETKTKKILWRHKDLISWTKGFSRKTEKILWKDILEIKFINTDSGPAAPDVWLTILGKNSACLIPQGAKGFETVYDIVSKYEGFNFENVTKSMRSTNNDEFILWKK